MNWLLKLLGYRDREYRGGEFSVRIEPIMREVVSVVHTRDGISLKLNGERIGKKWEGIRLNVPQEVEDRHVPQIVNDLQTAFRAMQYDYVIARPLGVDVVPESERQAAIAELRDMGYEIEVSEDQKQIRQKKLPGAPPVDRETARKQIPRMVSLLQSVHGKRPRFETLAKSKEF